ncbi:MAG: hypothetical protein IRZ05_00390 [Micromonosporaceae bacterium]|nr:hypothetical protein [Micromonosporaceae bacterium]
MVALAGGCSRATDEAPVKVTWQEVSLPAPAGPAGRLALRDSTACGGRWYVVGAVVGADGATRPAAWASGDGRSWTPTRVEPRSTYGKVAVLYAAGCRGGMLAAIGAQSGGAHGNPRVTQWRLRPDGVLDEVPAAFELYGGPDAVNVGRIAGGPPGWLVAGNRVGGAAVWVAGPTATGFRLVDRAPGLASDGQLATEATDATAYRGGWVVVGGGRRRGQRGGEPLAWTSADGLSWRRTSLPVTGGDEYRLVQRVVAAGDSLVAAGLDGGRFGAWRLTGDGWQEAGRFGTLTTGAAQQILGLASAGGRVWAAGCDGRVYGLWSSSGEGAWRSVQLPLAPPAPSGDHVLTVSGAGRSILLIADDGRRSRAWWAA